MISTKQKLILDRISFINIAVDLLLSVLVGSTVSVLMFLGLMIVVNGGITFSELIDLSRDLFSPLSGKTDQAVRFVLMLPILVPFLSILLTRRLVQRVTSRTSWILPIIVIAVTSTMIGLLSVYQIFIKAEWTLSYADIGVFIPFYLFCIFFGLLIGMSLGIIFVPERRVFKILVALIASAIVGGLFEIATFLLLSMQ